MTRLCFTSWSVLGRHCSVTPRQHALCHGRHTSRSIVYSMRIDDNEDPSAEELLEECDEIEAEIDVADFDNVSVELTEESEDDMMSWAGYMQRDLVTGEPGSTEHDSVEDKAIYRDNISGISSNPVVTESSAARFFDGDTLPLKPRRGRLTEWDLRASMETKRWFEQDYNTWQAFREKNIGRYSSVASDWRTDVRIKESLDPAEVDYREWSMKEIWDLITQNGEAADPRDVPFVVQKPGARTNFVAEGYVHHPGIPQWLDEQGRLMKDEDAEKITDDEAEGALLTSEFSDFDTEFDFSNDDDDV